jgi:hypothetical protein
MSVRFASGGRFGSTNTQAALSPTSFSIWCKPVNFPTGPNFATFFLQCDDSGTNFINMLSVTAVGFVSWYTFTTGVSNVISTNVIKRGEWSHICGTLTDGGTQDLYVNGMLENSQGLGSVQAGTFRILLGGNPGGPIGTANFVNFDGELQDAAIWTTQLLASEVRELARGRSPVTIRPQTDLRNYWPLAQEKPFIDLSRRKELLVPTSQWWPAHQVEKMLTERDALAGESLVPSTLFVPKEDSSTIYVDIQPGGTEIGPTVYTDAATVYVDIQVATTDVLLGVEASTVLVDIQTSSVESYVMVDSATILIDIRNTGAECLSTFSANYFGEGDDFLQWGTATEPLLQWLADANTQWEASVSIGEAIHC